jgi:hypothetical protein
MVLLQELVRQGSQEVGDHRQVCRPAVQYLFNSHVLFLRPVLELDLKSKDGPTVNAFSGF